MRRIGRRARAAATWAAALWLSALPGCGEQVDVVVRVDEAPLEDFPLERCPHGGWSGVTREGPLALAQLSGDARATAVCTCDDLSSADALQVPVGDVVVDGALRQSGPLTITSDLRVAGADGVALGPTLARVEGDLAVAGALLGADAVVSIGGRAQLGGRVQVGTLEVAGGIELATDAELLATELITPTQPVRTVVEVSPGCDCDDAHRLDPDAEAWSRATPTTVPGFGADCDAIALPGDAMPPELWFDHSGLVLVDGDLAAQSGLWVRVAPGELVDIVVLGNVNVAGRLSLGDVDGGRVRLFVAGGGTIRFQRGGNIHGLLHAPDAELVLPARLEVRGALFVRRIAAAAPLIVSLAGSG